MKKSSFKIRISRPLGEYSYKEVSGYIFKFRFNKSEEVFYLGAVKAGRLYNVYELESGIRLHSRPYYKKDIVYYTGKEILKFSRWRILEQLDRLRMTDEERERDFRAELAHCKCEEYFPANNTELEKLIKNHWYDDTSHIIGKGLTI
ncbi:MAG: hypothetical protein ACLR7Q_09580 [Eubacterium sp.]